MQYSQRKMIANDGKTKVRRLFDFSQIFFFALTYMSGWETMALPLRILQATLINGGLGALVWGILKVVAGALAQADLSQKWPPHNHWTKTYAPASQRRFITWTQGWMTCFAWISTLAGVPKTTALMLKPCGS
ncbi:hypothetical protein MBLNU13_g04770t1 [Cladosporium sp. NU13]